MIQLKTKRLIIRDPQPTDLENWHHLMSDPDTMYYLPGIMTHSRDESWENLEAAVAEAHNSLRTKYFLTIEDGDTGKFIGTVGYTVHQNTPGGKFAGAGYFILPEYRGQGITTEALAELIRFAFETGGIYRMDAHCLAENRASERVMQKCGLIKEAEHKAYVWHDGELKDRVEYRLLKEEWFHNSKYDSREFWQTLEKLVDESEIVINRVKGSAHPRYPHFNYPLDFGYLKDTITMDGGGVDVWRGSDPGNQIDAIICTVDLIKRDSESKILIGCTEEEKMKIYQVYNETEMMKGVLIRKPAQLN